MDREILFRGFHKEPDGKSIAIISGKAEHGTWICGNLLRTDEGLYIIQNYVPQHMLRKYAVDPSTVGQYTGLTDKNGKKIFEGDIVRWTWEPYVLVSPGGYCRYPYGSKFEVRLLESGFMLCKVGDQMPDIPNANGKVANYEFWNYHRGLEIIGNIHDNPELIGGEDDG